MKKVLSLLAAGIVAVSATVSLAQAPAATPDPVGGPPAAMAPGAAGDLFQCVKYVSCRDIAPCAKPMVVEVRDPCWKPDPCNPCCKPRCVKVQICAPESCCSPCIKCTRDGKTVRYDFGKYAVSIHTRKNDVLVSYHD